MFDTGSFNFLVLDKSAPDLPPYASKLACPIACGNMTAGKLEATRKVFFQLKDGRTNNICKNDTLCF